MASGDNISNGVNGSKVALITGITGQDGSYLAELLLSKGYQVHGIIRRSSSFNTGRIEHLYADPVAHTQGADASFRLHYGDLTDNSNLVSIINTYKPDEIYNLGAQSHVKVSFEQPHYTAEVDAIGTLNILDAIRACNLTKTARFYQASTSEMYGNSKDNPQSELTRFYPRSPYGVAKVFAHQITVNYREAYGMFNCCGILFNHESPRRGENFVTRKITRGVAKISLGQQEFIELGNLDSKRDWGHAKDYVEAIWLILQQSSPSDYVIATGETHSVRKFVEASFDYIGVKIRWDGEGVNEKGFDEKTGKLRVAVNEKFFRPAEIDLLIGDSSKAERVLGWKRKIDFKGLVKDMMDADIKLMKQNPTA